MLLLAPMVLASQDTGNGSTGNINTGGGGGGGGKTYFYDVRNLSHQPVVPAGKNLNDYAPSCTGNKSQKSKCAAAARSASRKVLNMITGQCKKLSNKHCIAWYNKKTTVGSEGAAEGQIHAFYDPWRSLVTPQFSGLIANYNVRLWRANSDGKSWRMIFQRRVGGINSPSDKKTKNSEAYWYFGGTTSESIGGFWKKSSNNPSAGSLFNMTVRRSYAPAKSGCEKNWRDGKNGQLDAAGKKVGWNSKMRIPSYARPEPIKSRGLWRSNGSLVHPGWNGDCSWEVFPGSTSLTKGLHEALRFRWRIPTGYSKSGSEFQYRFEGMQRFYMMQVVPLEQREEILHHNGNINKNRGKCVREGAAVRKASTTYYDFGAKTWLCDNFIRVFWGTSPSTTNVVFDPDGDPGEPRVTLTSLPNPAQVGQQTTQQVSVENPEGPVTYQDYGSSTFLRQVELTHFTPQENFSGNSKAAYADNYISYGNSGKNDSRILRASKAPDRAGGSPLYEANLIAPSLINDGSGIANNFDITWRAPTIQSPCEIQPLLKTDNGIKISQSSSPWPQDLQNCRPINQNKQPKVFNAWDDWLSASVAYEQRKIKNTAGDGKVIIGRRGGNDLSTGEALRCSNGVRRIRFRSWVE